MLLYPFFFILLKIFCQSGRNVLSTYDRYTVCVGEHRLALFVHGDVVEYAQDNQTVVLIGCKIMEKSTVYQERGSSKF